LQSALWPGDTFVDFDHGLNNAVKRIRAVLGDSADAPRYIETLPRMGYRFIGPINGNGNGISSNGNGHNGAGVAAATYTKGVDAAQPSWGSRKWKLAIAAGIVIAGLAGWGWRTWARHFAVQPSLSIVPFTSYPGAEYAPAFSPDGNQIAFAWNGGEHSDKYDLYVKEVGTETPVRLTHQPLSFMAPAWSPDGRYIAVIGLDTASGKVGLFLMPPTGGSERQLLSVTSLKYVYALGLSWTSDSQWVAFARSTGSEFRSHQAMVNISTLEVRELPDPSPKCSATGLAAFSPDGKKLAMACMYTFGLSGIYVQPYPSGRPQEVERLKGELEGMQWTNDGRGLVYSSNNNLWRIRSNGGTPERLWFAQDALMPAIARQGNRLAYVHQVFSADIWRISLGKSGGEPTRPFPSNLVQQNAQFSPDGTRIAFESTRSGSPEVWVCNVDGSQLLQLSSFGGPLTGTPRWSPDGRKIVLDSRASGRPELYIVSSDGGKPQLFATTPEGGSVPFWSHDGRWIYFTSDVNEDPQLFKIPAEGGKAIQLTSKGGMIAKESFDGQRLYYTNPDARNALWSVQANGEDEKPIEGLPAMAWPAWDVGPRGIYYFDTLRSDSGIYYFDVTTHRSRVIGKIPGEPRPYSSQISVSPDEKTVLYSQLGQRTGDIVMVEGFR
jgi:Tol biopolymer transport system component